MKYGPLLIIVAATLWALDGLLRRSLYGLPSSTLIFFEHLIGFVLIAPFAWKEFRKIRLSRSEKVSLFSVSLLSGVIGTLLFTMALAAVGFIPMSVAILIQKLQPIFAISVAVIMGRERIPKLSLAFILLALISGYFVTFPDGVSNSPDGQKQLLAALYALGAAASWGISTNFSKYLLKNHSPEVVTFMRFTITTILISIGLLFIPDWNSGFRMPTNSEWLYLFFIALSTGLVAMYIYYRGLKIVPVHVSAILELTWPIVAVFVDYFVYHTVFAPSQYIAMGVLIGSMYMVTKLAHQKTIEGNFPHD
ncbi:MAG: DMT family transporter [Candidatus Altimarinota bacterium]